MTAANHKSTKVKKHLNAMSKNSKLHRLRTTRRIIKYGTISFTRNVWLSIAATLVMTITLIILFATAITSVILSSTADDMREKIDITIFFKPNTPRPATKPPLINSSLPICHKALFNCL